MMKKLFSTFLSILVAFSCFGMCSNNVSAKGADRVIILHYKIVCTVDSKSGEQYNYHFDSKYVIGGWGNSYDEIKNDVECASSVMESIDDSVKQGTKLEAIVAVEPTIKTDSDFFEYSLPTAEHRSLCAQLNSELGCDNIKFIPYRDYKIYYDDIFKSNNVVNVRVPSTWLPFSNRELYITDDSARLNFAVLRDEKFDALIKKGDRTQIYEGKLATNDIERFKFSELIKRLATGWIPSYEYFSGKSYNWMKNHTEEEIKHIMYETQTLYIPENHNFPEELANPVKLYDVLDKNEFAADHDQNETTDTPAEELVKPEESLADQSDVAEPKSGALKKMAIGTGIVAIPAAICGVYKYVSNLINKKPTPQTNQNLNSNTSDVVAESRL